MSSLGFPEAGRSSGLISVAMTVSRPILPTNMFTINQVFAPSPSFGVRSSDSPTVANALTSSPIV
jgi:hypothetical protein